MCKRSLELKIEYFTKLIDDSIAEGDNESAEELLKAVEAMCDELDAMQ